MKRLKIIRIVLIILAVLIIAFNLSNNIDWIEIFNLIFFVKIRKKYLTKICRLQK